MIQGPVHPSFGLVKCIVGLVYPSNSAFWMGIPHPSCTEYDRTTKQAAKLVDMLAERGPTAFDIFVGALRVNGQLDLAMELEKQENDARVLFPIVQYF